MGYRDIEFDAFGVPKGERIKRLEEYLTLVERLWTEDRVSYEGPGCRLDNVHMNIRPVQTPRPPIWMAANNDPAVKRAARMADAWLINPHATSDTIRRQMVGYRAELEAAGKDTPRELPVVRQGWGDRTRNGRIAPGCLGDGAARAGLQSHPCHEHHGHSATHGRDEGIVKPKKCSHPTIGQDRDASTLPVKRFYTTKTPCRHWRQTRCDPDDWNFAHVLTVVWARTDAR